MGRKRRKRRKGEKFFPNCFIKRTSHGFSLDNYDLKIVIVKINQFTIFFVLIITTHILEEKTN